MFAYCNNNPVILCDSTGCAASSSDDNNNNGIPDYLETRWVEMSNRYRSIFEGNTPRDVTAEVDAVLNQTVLLTQLSNDIDPISSKFNFYNKVNHRGPWDIKRPDSWKATIGTEFPGSSNTVVIYRGHYYTPEILGNYTYGAIGKAAGFDLPLLLAGSYYAADCPNQGTGTYDNEMLDWLFIAVGYNR